MKNNLYRFLAVLLIFSSVHLGAQTRDYRKTEEIINQILDNGEPGVKPPAGTEKTGETEKIPQDNTVEQPEKPDEAEEETTAERAVVPGGDSVLLKSGISLFSSGDLETAGKSFNDLMEKYPASRHADTARIWLGRISIKKNDYSGAIEELSSINENSGEYPAAQYNIAYCLNARGNTASAISRYQLVAYRFSGHELADDALLQAGILFARQGKGNEAISAFITILKQYKNRETVDDALFNLGRVFESDPTLRDIERASRIYRLFLKKSEQGLPHFKNSPLKDRVARDLAHIEKTYFRKK